ncbi:MAG: LysM peptidoglycan-binding domain-containing protein [Anaerolineae bacterium]|nr:LysM peptidoglycan-binding domain-containing protein [Anaerolineae bacterium]
MRKRRGCIKWVVVAALVVAAVSLIAFAAFALLQARMQQARAQYEPPTVLVTEPASGVSAYAGSYLTVSATALGPIPIRHIELWMDGELTETQGSEQPEGVSPLYANFSLLIPEGYHMLFVRAVNTKGMIGQSEPIGLVGESKPGPGEVFYAVPVSAGETLADIAAAYDTEPGVLQELNPDLGGQEPATGAVLKVPIPPKEEAAAPGGPPAGPTVPGGPSVGPTIPPGGPTVTSTLPSPSGPQLGIYKPLIVPGLVMGILLGQNAPAAPTNLIAEVKECKVTLRWNDNANNEASYDVWMAGLGQPPRKIASLQPSASTGPAWFEFPGPQPGFFSFWVEAVNSLGRQPSNIIWVLVHPECPATLATHLQVEAVDMTVDGNYDRAYCYVSFEGRRAIRLPESDDAFIKVEAGKADIAAWAAGNDKLVVPMPTDGAFDIAGECWGWSGDGLNRLGSFSDRFASETWDGITQWAPESGPFRIGMAIKPLGAMDARGAYGSGDIGTPGEGTWITEYSLDPSLSAPDNLRAEEIPGYPGWRRLRWDWAGDEKAINGFILYTKLEGTWTMMWSTMGDEYVSSAMREEVVPVWGCGERDGWRVSAYRRVALSEGNWSEPRESELSQPVEYDQPKCQALLQVVFREICLDRTDDGWPGDSCDTLDAYWQISVDDVTKSFYGGTSFRPIKCGCQSFSELAESYIWSGIDPQPDTIIIPLDPSKLIKQGIAQPIVVRTRFWDYDDWGSDDPFGKHAGNINLGDDLKPWELMLGDCTFEVDMGKMLSEEADTTVKVVASVWPNECGDLPSTMDWRRPPGSPPKADLEVNSIAFHPGSILGDPVKVVLRNRGPDLVDMDVPISCIGEVSLLGTGAGQLYHLPELNKTVHVRLGIQQRAEYQVGHWLFPVLYNSWSAKCSIPAMALDPEMRNNEVSTSQTP